MKQSFIICTLIFVLFSCKKQEKSDMATITGKLLTQDVNEVKLEWIIDNPIYDFGEDFFAEVDSSFYFSFKIPNKRLATGRIVSGGYYHDICILPGDNFNIIIKADTIHFTGKGAEKNNFLYASEINQTHDQAYYSTFNDGNLTLSDFVTTMKEFKQKRLDFLDSYPNKSKLEPEFIDYYKIQTQVIYEHLIQNYPNRYAYAMNIYPDSIILPEEYSRMNQLSQFVDDRKVMVKEYIPNLQTFLYLIKSKEIRKADTLLNFKDALLTVLFDSLQGKTQEYLLAHWLCSEFSNGVYDTLVYKKFLEIDKDELSSTTVKESIDKYNIKQSLIGQPLHSTFIETMLEDTMNTKLSFGEMMNKYKGKVVYLDIWSLNCGPCRASMSYSKKLKESLADLPIEFVYIAQDPPDKDVWKKIFDVSLTRNNQYRMVKYDWGSSEMLKFMEINWVPCYMIFDKQGNLIDYNADPPHPLKNGESQLEITLKDLANK